MFTLRKLFLFGLTLILLVSGLHPAASTLAQSTIEEGDRPRTGLQAAAAAAGPALPAADLQPEQLAGGPILPQPNNLSVWSRIVYAYYDRSDFDISISDNEGRYLKRIVDIPGSDIQPSLNRGGTMVAFASDRNSGYDIYTVKSSGGEQTRLTGNKTDDVTPAWSPDGKKIAFTSYRDGHAEVYVMNANGTGQTRLTRVSTGYNGEPAWSPDGKKIAFTSYRSQAWRIWVMNADGSSQKQISQQQFSENPVWSLDGKKIAYDCDGDGNGWQETWWMDAQDGANARRISPSRINQDFLANGWSPDRQYVAVNRVSYVLYSGKYYWTNANIAAISVDAIDYENNDQYYVTQDNTSWMADWQTLDLIPPTATVKALPAQSPGPFTVVWGGTDKGGSGLVSYTVQLRVGKAGQWTDWKVNTILTSASYPGVAGETYAFRTRAIDASSNMGSYPANASAVTTVETLPPICHIPITPRVFKIESGAWLQIHYDATDPGGSGIKSYEGQVWDGSELMPISEFTEFDHAPFLGSSGKTYQFRCRAGDTAGNQGKWQAGFDTTTSFYESTLSGSVFDNAGTPMVGVQIQSDPPAAYISPNEENGGYHAYVSNQEETPYTLTWSAPSRLAAPGSRLPGSGDQTHDAFMPPADNVIADWGFESGNLAANGWQISEDNHLVQDIPLTYSGQFALRMGHTEGFSNPALLFNTPNNVSILAPKLLATPDGTLHLLWAGGLYYSSRPPNSDTWSAPLEISLSPDNDKVEYDLKMDSNGNLHVIWVESYNTVQQLRHRVRSSQGIWSSITTISNPAQPASEPQMELDSAGALHVIWKVGGQNWYVSRTPSGVWEPAKEIFGYTVQMAVDGLKRVHFAWDGGNNLLYQRREADGSWSAVKDLGLIDRNMQMAVEPDGTVHMIWMTYSEAVYASRTPGGTWSPATVIEPTFPHVDFTYLVQAADKTLYFFWQAGNKLHLDRRKPGETWTQDGVIANADWFGPVKILTDSLSQAHVFSRPGFASPEIMYWHSNSQGSWSPPELVNVGDNFGAAIDADDGLHVMETRPEGVYHATHITAEQASTQTLSQVVSLPENASHPILSFLMRSGDLADNGRFLIQATQGQTTETLYSSIAGKDAWAHTWLDMSRYTGKTFTLTFKLEQDSNRPYAAVNLDEITLGSVSPDLWVGLGRDPGQLMPGSPVTLTITYGNRGGVPSPSAKLILTMPGELIFDSASTPPAFVEGSTITWDIDDLPANSGPRTIQVMASVNPNTAGFKTVTAGVEIQTDTLELTTVNNTASAAVSIQGHLYLPIILR